MFFQSYLELMYNGVSIVSMPFTTLSHTTYGFPLSVITFVTYYSPIIVYDRIGVPA